MNKILRIEKEIDDELTDSYNTLNRTLNLFSILSSVMFILFNAIIIFIAIEALKKSNAIFILFSKIRYEKVLYYRYYFKELSYHLKMINIMSLGRALFEF